jgi:O-antigen biosynthesis protein WbqP
MNAKRIFDFLLAAALSIPALIICAVFAPFIFWETRATPIFRQTRLGRNNIGFEILKLRTMKPDTADVASHEVSQSQITRLGYLLRRFKFDELPQLFNVLNGTMSFVGPRPCLPSQMELIEERTSRNVSSLLPGITGPAQLVGLDMSTPRELAIADSAYIGAWSFWTDLKILFYTFAGGGRGDAALGSKANAKSVPTTLTVALPGADGLKTKVDGQRKKAVVSGASGFLGKAVVAALAAEGWHVATLVRKRQKTSGLDVVQHCFEDLATADHLELAGIMADADCVVHLAAVVPGKRAGSGGGTVDMAKAMGAAAALAGVTRLIVLSSAYAALAEANKAGAREYGREKLAADRALEQFRSKELRMVFLRPPVVYGQGMSGAMSKLASMVAKGVPLPFGRAHEPRSYISKTNLVNLISELTRASDHSWTLANGRAYTPTDGAPVSTSELVKAIGHCYGRKAYLIPIPLSALKLLGRLTRTSDMLSGAVDPLYLDDNMALLKDFGWAPVEQFPLSLRSWIGAVPLSNKDNPSQSDRLPVIGSSSTWSEERK